MTKLCIHKNTLQPKDGESFSLASPMRVNDDLHNFNAPKCPAGHSEPLLFFHSFLFSPSAPSCSVVAVWLIADVYKWIKLHINTYLTLVYINNCYDDHNEPFKVMGSLISVTRSRSCGVRLAYCATVS